MKKLLFMLILSLVALNAQTAEVFEENAADIAEKSRLMDFYTCRDYVSQAIKNHPSQVLEDNPNRYKVKLWTDDAGFVITCTHTVVGTKH